MKKLPKRNGIRHESRQPEPSTQDTMRSALAHMMRLAADNLEETESRAISAQTRGRKAFARILLRVPFGGD